MTSRGPHVYNKHEHMFDVPRPSTNQSRGIAVSGKYKCNVVRNRLILMILIEGKELFSHRGWMRELVEQG